MGQFKIEEELGSGVDMLSLAKIAQEKLSSNSFDLKKNDNSLVSFLDDQFPMSISFGGQNYTLDYVP